MELVASACRRTRRRASHWRAGGYLKSTTIPRDPWGNEYRYLQPGSKGGEYDLYSFGADGELGGEDADADISSWNLE